MLKDIKKVSDIKGEDYVRYLQLLETEKNGIWPIKTLFFGLWLVPAAFLAGTILTAINSITGGLIFSAIGLGITLPTSSIVTLHSKHIYKELKKETVERSKELKELKKIGQWDTVCKLMDLYVKADFKTLNAQNQTTNKEVAEKTFADEVSYEYDGTIQL